jgi:hypothetical protein
MLLKKVLFSLVALFIFGSGFSKMMTGQEYRTRVDSDTAKVHVVQLSGVIKSSDSVPLPYANVSISGTRYGVSANIYGYFTIPVKENDLIVFTFIGFKASGFRVPKVSDGNKLSIVQYMEQDTQYLNEVVVNPWPSSAEFSYVFVHKDIPDDDLERALKNLDPVLLQSIADNMGRDGKENATAFFAELADQNSRLGGQPYNPFFMTGPNGQIIPAVNFTKLYAYMQYLQRVKAKQKKK